SHPYPFSTKYCASPFHSSPAHAAGPSCTATTTGDGRAAFVSCGLSRRAWTTVPSSDGYVTVVARAYDAARTARGAGENRVCGSVPGSTVTIAGGDVSLSWTATTEPSSRHCGRAHVPPGATTSTQPVSASTATTSVVPARPRVATMRGLR